MLLVDLSHTSHTQAHTGIQRVCRSLLAALERRTETVPVTWDPFEQAWRRLTPRERGALLPPAAPSPSRKSRWTSWERWRGRLRRAGRSVARRAVEPVLSGDEAAHAALLAPEFFSASVARAHARLRAQIGGPAVAIFPDALALRFPELAPPGTVARYPTYLLELSRFDGVAGISAESRDALIGYWQWLGLPSPPPVIAWPLGLEKPPRMSEPVTQSEPILLYVSTLEGRKNHLALLQACEALWARGKRFRLRLIGLAHPQSGAAALARVRALQAAGRPLDYDGPASEERLEAAWAECYATVYPSLAEGFGLPVLESVLRGRPCLCSSRGALGEVASGGGCLMVERPDSAALTVGIERLLEDRALYDRLVTEARARPHRSWDDGAGELLAWIEELQAARRTARRDGTAKSA